MWKTFMWFCKQTLWFHNDRWKRNKEASIYFAVNYGFSVSIKSDE